MNNKIFRRKFHPFLFLVVLLFLVSAPGSDRPTVVSGETGGTVRFAVIGDFGDGSQAEADVAALVDSKEVDFVATVGDNNYPDGAAETIDQNIGQYYHHYIRPYTGDYGPGASDTNRFFPALGNHDWHSITCAGAVCSGPYFDYFQLPGNERYYDVEWGDVHLFILDSDEREPDGKNHPSVQSAWLRDGLATSTARWQLVFMHHAPFSSALSHGSTPDLQWPYREWGAEAVLAGHDHVYERLMIDGLPYFVNGLGGKSLRRFGTPLPGSEVRFSEDYGAMFVEAGETEINFRFVTRKGLAVDTYTLPFPAGPECATATACVYFPVVSNIE